MMTDQQTLRERRKEMLLQMEQRLRESQPKEEDSLFYYHASDDRIVLSHALFWVMTRTLKGKIAKERYFLLLRQYEEEMLEAFLTEDDYFSEILHYCNIIYETLPLILTGAHNLRAEKDARRLAAITVVAGGYGGDMPEDLCYELLDDIDFHYNKVKCRKIEQMLPLLSRMVAMEEKSMAGIGKNMM